MGTRRQWLAWVVVATLNCGGHAARNAKDGDSSSDASSGGSGNSDSASSGSANDSSGGANTATATNGFSWCNGTGAANGLPPRSEECPDDGPITDPPGPVRCGNAECADGEACCLASSSCFDPNDPSACPRPETSRDPSDTPCASNAHCAPDELCLLENDGLCEGSGHCQPRTNVGGCLGAACTICACDGNSYPNRQTAARAGTQPARFQGGACGDTITLGGGGAGGVGSGKEQRTVVVTLCGWDTDCGKGELCCTLTGICYPEDDPGQCQTPPKGTSAPCTSDAQCYPYEYCAGEGCEGPGGCVHIGDSDCGVTLEPVCACDGTTYTSAACARDRGVRIAHEGECE